MVYRVSARNGMLLLFKLLSSHRLLWQPKDFGINGISGRTTSTFPLELCYRVVLLKDILFKQINVGISFKSTIQHLNKPKTTNNIQEQKCVEFTNSHAVHVNYHTSDRESHCLRGTKKDIRYIKQNDPQSACMLHILNNNHENGPMNTTMTILKQIIKTSLLWGRILRNMVALLKLQKVL